MLKKIVNKREFLLFSIGSLLVIITILLMFYERIILIKETLFVEIDSLISSENIKSNLVNIDTNYYENINDEVIDNNSDNNISDNNEDNSTTNIKKDYIGYLEIPKISLKYGFVSINSYFNNVDRNIQIINTSSYPDVEGGNFIIAGHSGNSAISYFRNLFLLKEGDIARITYKNSLYTYKIVNIYKVDKTGSVNIVRDTSKTTLTLITCSYKDRKHQTVYIAELQSVI